MAIKDYYDTKKAEVDGIIFDSKWEAEYYELLLKKQEAGIIKEIELQPVLNLAPAFNYYGKNRRRVDYKLDFRVVYSDDVEVYIDIKGMATDVALLKRKWAEAQFRDKQIIWLTKSIKWGDRFGWIEYDELKRIRDKNRREKNKRKKK